MKAETASGEGTILPPSAEGGLEAEGGVFSFSSLRAALSDVTAGGEGVCMVVSRRTCTLVFFWLLPRPS